jgi:hypothetical protein
VGKELRAHVRTWQKDHKAIGPRGRSPGLSPAGTGATGGGGGGGGGSLHSLPPTPRALGAQGGAAIAAAAAAAAQRTNSWAEEVTSPAERRLGTAAAQPPAEGEAEGEEVEAEGEEAAAARREQTLAADTLAADTLASLDSLLGGLSPERAVAPAAVGAEAVPPLALSEAVPPPSPAPRERPALSAEEALPDPVPEPEPEPAPVAELAEAEPQGGAQSGLPPMGMARCGSVSLRSDAYGSSSGGGEILLS